MAFDAALQSVKTFQTGETSWQLIDDGRQPQFTDLVTEVRSVNGIVYVTLACSVCDQGTAPEAHIAARLRMSITAAQFLQSQLAGAVGAALSPDVGDSVN